MFNFSKFLDKFYDRKKGKAITVELKDIIENLNDLRLVVTQVKSEVHGDFEYRGPDEIIIIVGNHTVKAIAQNRPRLKQ